MEEQEIDKLFIDYGNTSSSAKVESTVNGEKKYDFITAHEGELCIPSVVYVTEEDEKDVFLYGEKHVENYKYVILHLKSKYLKAKDLKTEKFSVVKFTKDMKAMSSSSHDLKIEPIVEGQFEYFKKLITEKYKITERTEIIASIPNVYFDNIARERYVALLEKTFNVKDIFIVRESDAVLFTKKILPDYMVILMDIGGGTSDVSVIYNNKIELNTSIKKKVQGGKIKEIGGRTYTEEILKLYEQYNINGNGSSFWEKNMDLFNAIEDVKIRISNMLSKGQMNAKITIPKTRIVQDRIEKISDEPDKSESTKKKLIEELEKGIQISTASFKEDDHIFSKIDKIYIENLQKIIDIDLKDFKGVNKVLVISGGGSKMYTLKKALEKFCLDNKDKYNISFDGKFNSTTAVVDGLTLYSTVGKNIKQLENPIGILLTDGEKPVIKEIFEKNDKIGEAKKYYFNGTYNPKELSNTFIFKFGEVLIADENHINDYGKVEFYIGKTRAINFFVQISITLEKDFSITIEISNARRKSTYRLNNIDKKRVAKEDFLNYKQEGDNKKSDQIIKIESFKVETKEFSKFALEHANIFEGLFKKSNLSKDDKDLFLGKRKIDMKDGSSKKMKVGSTNFIFEDDTLEIIEDKTNKVNQFVHPFEKYKKNTSKNKSVKVSIEELEKNGTVDEIFEKRKEYVLALSNLNLWDIHDIDVGIGSNDYQKEFENASKN